MPELPEVEVTRMGIEPMLQGQNIAQINIYHKQLRWPIVDDLKSLVGQTIKAVSRRAKYLVIEVEAAYVLIHLGMSGKLCVVDKCIDRLKHDHFEMILTTGQALRLNDPRRFGAVLMFHTSAELELWLAKLGPEPLSDAFNPSYLFSWTRKRQVAIKNCIMDNKVVVGVGNIYATESLFKAGIHPQTPANTISQAQCHQLVDEIKMVLARAIKQGGTTLKDFAKADGKPGYFAQELLVYGRSGEKCKNCDATIQTMVIGQRASAFCPSCQPL
ncbi:formamidopyrimidine/5-formyluracil/ 5-hydroxymethyluracil DNA glycosylase [Catenovulum agarivorans DS-2]|uniref:Formamidopyrimidine-DNA glycosylase n=1 Tax=Catenovulum agarivorans DS-2 TaxID=1328313 RepID=W7QSJ7_9ALTE|nr:bifunctional DNA-formamidopyrimidine glycosylase/DNA-(apurinic or apyrimidinic site) lyase [Catenovulum agarivorans]EWH10843.1 formamidopyrimidine/5-formyluracil/ 5-hydroxymethyluracil DNA glycosylase [Catenovulum agarivorans DS-2]